MYRGTRLASALLGAALSLQAGRAEAVVDCTGQVSNLSLGLNVSGTVTLSLAGGPAWVYLCTTAGAPINGVATDVCKTMDATLLLAKATGKQVLIRFYEHESCTAIPPWAGAGTLGWTQVMLD